MAIASLSRKHRRHVIELVLMGLLALVVAGMDVMFVFWPFRYREVHPLLQQTFLSRVDVKRYRRTYFPHPGYVADGITFYRHGDMSIPPLATLDHMTVIGTWTSLIFHPNQLYEIRLDGLHVQIPPPGTKANGTDFNGSVFSSSKQKIEIETIVANDATLDFSRREGSGPLRFRFSALQIHNVQENQPFTFFGDVTIPEPNGRITVNGSIGPIRTNDYGATLVSGAYSLLNGDLSRLPGLSGHPVAGGQYRGRLSKIEVVGHASIPDFRSRSAHKVRLDAVYHVTVNGTNGDTEIHDARVRTGESTITASGSVAGTPKKVAITIATEHSRVGELLRIIEAENPSVEGGVSFRAAVDVGGGPGEFLQRLNLMGEISLEEIRFVTPRQQEMDSFSARVRKDPQNGPANDPPQVRATASSHTRFQHGMAYFPDILVAFPGARAHLHGTLNLISTKVHLTGKVALQQSVSKAATGPKAWLLKPLNLFFRKRNAGAVVSIAVTGTAQQPDIGQNILHTR